MIDRETRPQEGDLILTFDVLRCQAQVLNGVTSVSWASFEKALAALQRYATSYGVDVWKRTDAGGYEPVLRRRRPNAGGTMAYPASPRSTGMGRQRA